MKMPTHELLATCNRFSTYGVNECVTYFSIFFFSFFFSAPHYHHRLFTILRIRFSLKQSKHRIWKYVVVGVFVLNLFCNCFSWKVFWLTKNILKVCFRFSPGRFMPDFYLWIEFSFNKTIRFEVSIKNQTTNF